MKNTYEIQSSVNGFTIELFEAEDDETALEHAKKGGDPNWLLFRLVGCSDPEPMAFCGPRCCLPKFHEGECIDDGWAVCGYCGTIHEGNVS